MTPPSLMSAQFPASDLSPRAHSSSSTSSSVATSHPGPFHAPPTPSEAHILASLRRDAAAAAAAMEFHPPQYTTPAVPRSVKFELVEDSHQYRARIPMRVQIYPHDTTESIISTVKNFYGLYPTPTSCPGVSFEDEHGNTIIGRYENFRHNSVVYVRVRDGPPTPGPPAALANGSGAQTFYTQDGYPIHCAQPQNQQHLSRPVSRSSRRRSVSPGSVNGRRSTSASTSSKHARPRSSKNRGSGSQTNAEPHSESLNGYTSSDGAPGSSSGKPKEQIGSTEISLDNIVEGGRRKRAKFESSELPLFAPPQMPAAISNPSVSPARRTEYNRASLPFVLPGQNPFSNPRVLQSPQTNGTGYNGTSTYPTPAPASHPSRGTASYTTGTAAGPLMGILATPDPTVGSCMSEEDKDVAMQLMRLGDISNISHGRTSASTLDDTFSRNADAASSTGATSDGESESETDEKPLMQKHRLNAADAGRKLFAASGPHFSSAQAESEQSDGDDGYSDSAPDGTMAAPKHKPTKAPIHHHIKSRLSGSKQKINKATKSIKTATGAKVKKSGSIPNGPMSPASLPASRKPSIVSSPPGAAIMSTEDDQPDLSTKPRCQRCRKSKKGCDRQRPCGRCRDAGIPAELCISEDEGNGRKGRYGRHMGVPVKKDHLDELSNGLLPPAPIATTTALLIGVGSADKNKKRKR